MRIVLTRSEAVIALKEYFNGKHWGDDLDIEIEDLPYQTVTPPASDSHSPQEPTPNVRTGRTNRWERWTQKDEQCLRELLSAGTDLASIAKKLGRGQRACAQRAWKLGLGKDTSEPPAVPQEPADEVPLSERRRLVKEQYARKGMVRPEVDEAYMRKVKAELHRARA